MCPRLPLGVPNRLGRAALEAAEGLIRAPGSQRAAGQGCEREAGYVIMSALCASGALDADKVSRGLRCCTSKLA